MLTNNIIIIFHPFPSSCFLTEDNSNAPDRMASVQGTPEQVQKVQSMIQEIVEQVTMEEFCQFFFSKKE